MGFFTNDFASKNIGTQIRHRQEIEISDADLLQLIISNIDRNINAVKLVEMLVSKFGSAGSVFHASIESLCLVDGMTEKCAVLLKFFELVHVRIAKSRFGVRTPLDDPAALQQYLILRMAHLEREEFWILYLDNQSKLIRDERVSSGTVNSCHIYPREIVQRAIELGATSLILVHNHPSRRNRPSLQDMRTTNELSAIARLLEISVQDHFIVSGDECISMRRMGYM